MNLPPCILEYHFLLLDFVNRINVAAPESDRFQKWTILKVDDLEKWTISENERPTVTDGPKCWPLLIGFGRFQLGL